MFQRSQLHTPHTPAWFYRWASGLASASFKSQLDFVLNEVDPLLGIRRLAAELVAVTQETEDVKTFVLRPSVFWRGFVPGQYVAIELDVQGVRYRRNYSLSSSQAMFEGQRLVSITVKRVAGGVLSNYMHDHLAVGAIVHLSQARGAFVLANEEKTDTYPAPLHPAPLFVAAGSGITPVMAMIEALAASGQLARAVLIHAARYERDLIFHKRLAALARAHPEFRYCVQLSAGQGGRLTQASLLAQCPDIGRRAIYVCGPQGFMTSIEQAAMALGVPAQAIKTESFGLPAATRQGARASKEAPGPDGQKSVRVTLAKAHKTLQARGTQTLLELAEQAGLQPKYGCRSGICHECTCVKTSGRVKHAITGELMPDEQTHIQACMAIPVEDVAIASW